MKFWPFSKTESCSGVSTISDKFTTHLVFSFGDCDIECCSGVDDGAREQLSFIIRFFSATSRSYFSRSFLPFLEVSFVLVVVQCSQRIWRGV